MVLANVPELIKKKCVTFAAQKHATTSPGVDF